jgi:AcrR family transcriptional regulator
VRIVRSFVLLLTLNPSDTRDTARALPKGRQTRAAILEAALGQASHMGLEGLSIGALADAMHMSKSGVFAHFGSREELQISVIREYHERFAAEVFAPAIRAPRGLPRLRALFERWLRRVSVEIDSGCIYISGAVEFDDRPGAVRDALAQMVRTWHGTLEKAIRLAVDEGHLRADTDPHQMLFEIHGLILSLHHDARFLKLPGALERAYRAFERMLAHHLNAPGALARPTPPRAGSSATSRNAPRKPTRASTTRAAAGRARR